MRPLRVAIVGGGVAGLTAAFELSRHPECAVTVYQPGWRLGGKAASGRGVGGRIEEHGLHYWPGFYENAFRMIRAVYGELARPDSARIATWRQAFTPLDSMGIADPATGTPWTTVLPRTEGLPGEPDATLPDLLGYVRHLQAASDSVLRAVARDRQPTRLLAIADLLAVVTRGLVSDRVLTSRHGLDVLDGEDYRAWLRRHGALPGTLDSAFVRCPYLSLIADGGSGELSAAVALRACLRLFFTYRGPFAWAMEGSMGDIVIAPLYEMLVRRGVDFRFFHRVSEVHLSVDEPCHVEAIDVEIEARTEGYQPLVDVAGVPSWPAAPDLDQIEAANERKRLTVGNDFDAVVLAVGHGALPSLTKQLSMRFPAWRQMCETVRTTNTQAVQLWFHRPLEELGWRSEAGTILGGFRSPFDSVADMRRVLSHEPGHQARGLLYLAGPLDDASDDDDEDEAKVAARADRFVSHDLPVLLPELRTSDIADRFVTANLDPSDRYVLSRPGTSAARISPLDLLADNLTIAGDWTACGLNAGCVEAAVISGRLAAHALTGEPGLRDIIGWDHP
ncbi:MAG: FAD-dependent oxidoreductase [Acidobacteriota bacterium]